MLQIGGCIPCEGCGDCMIEREAYDFGIDRSRFLDEWVGKTFWKIDEIESESLKYGITPTLFNKFLNLLLEGYYD